MRFELKETETENGLRLIQAKVPANDATIIAHINAGPLYEPDNLVGISHFCEHIMYRGTKRRPSREAIYAESDKMGGMRQARTIKQRAEFGLRVVSDDFNQALDWLSDILYSAKIDDEDVEKEKGVVLDELRGEHDDPNGRFWKELNQIIFSGSELEKHVPGTEESVKAYTPAQVKAFYRSFFTPSNTTLLVAGPHDFSELTNIVKKYFSLAIKSEKKELPQLKEPVNTKREINISKDMGGVQLGIGRLVPTARSSDAYALRVFGSALNAAVFDKLVNQESCSYNCSAEYNDHSGLFGRIVLYATCAPEKRQRVKELMLEELKRFKDGKFSDEFIHDRIVQAKKAFVFDNDTTLNIALNMLKFNTIGNVYEINEYIPNLEKVTPETVREAAAKYISLDDLTIVSLGNLN